MNDEIIRAIMSKKEGRAWLYDILNRCNMFGSPIIPGDTHLTFANIGKSDIGKSLWMDLERAASMECRKMLKEANTAEEIV